MAEWHAGYVTELTYTQGYYRELSPLAMRFALHCAGYKAPPAQGFTYCELGFGQGISLNIHAAAHPDSAFWGNDFNPAHARHANALAQASGARFESWLLPREAQFNPEQVRWLRLIGNTLRANAGTLDDFTADHLDFFQSFTALGGQAAAVRLFGGALALETMLASLSLAVFSTEATGPGHSGDAVSASLH